MITDKARMIARKMVAKGFEELGYPKTALFVIDGYCDKSAMMQQAMQLLATIKGHTS